MSAPKQEDYLRIIASKLNGFETFAENFGRARFLVYESEIQAPDEDGEAFAEETAEMEAIAAAFRCEIKQSGNRFGLYFYMDERNPGNFLEIVDSGMPPPLAGGDHGYSHKPDGSVYPSPTPMERWDEPVEGYAKPATGVINEIQTMLTELFRQRIQEAVEESKQEILGLVKQYTVQCIRKGGS